MNRRQLLKGLLGASGVAVAAHFGAPGWMGDEIKEELVKDLSRTSVAVPGQVFDNRPVWTSVSGVQQVWKDHVTKELARQMDRSRLSEMDSKIDRTVNAMVRAVDLDLKKAEVDTDQKVIIEPPRVRLTSASWHGGTPVFELKAGLEKKDAFLGGQEYRVGYLAEKIIVPG